MGVTADGKLVASTIGAFAVTGASGDDVDLLAFTPTALGATTSGTWALYFDGSDVELTPLGNEDVNALWIDPATDKLYLSTLGTFTVTGASGGGDDVFACTPGMLGRRRPAPTDLDSTLTARQRLQFRHGCICDRPIVTFGGFVRLQK